MQDAYALCRVFKKISCRSKVEERPRHGGHALQEKHDIELVPKVNLSSRLPLSDTCSSDVTVGSYFDNGTVENVQFGRTVSGAGEEGEGSTNGSPNRVEQCLITDPLIEVCKQVVLPHLFYDI